MSSVEAIAIAMHQPKEQRAHWHPFLSLHVSSGVVDRAPLQRPDCFLAGGPNEKGRYSVDVIVDDDECLGCMFMVPDAIVRLSYFHSCCSMPSRMTREMQTLSFKPETCQHDLTTEPDMH